MVGRSLVSLAVAVAAVAALLFVASRAQAYELKRTESGDALYWREARVTFRVRESARCGPTREELLAAARMAADAWRGIGGAPDIVIEDGRASREAAVDGENGIYVVCEWEHGTTLGVTVGSHDAADGRMVDADVLLNGEMPFALMREGHEERHAHEYDLGSVLTHEMGHVLGLDESGERQATMWPRTQRGATSQRTLETDDEEGVAAIYARSARAALGEGGAAEGAVASGCSAAGGGGTRGATGGGGKGWPGAAAWLALVAWRRRRRRRSRRGPPS